jgi:DNA-binding FadR family transcriptional regulator
VGVKGDAVESLIRDGIRDGRFPPGGRVPSERELCAELRVSRTLVRLTLARLVAAGVLVVRHGSGYYVAE